MLKKRFTAILTAAALAFLVLPAAQARPVWADESPVTEAGQLAESGTEQQAEGSFTLTLQTDEEIAVTLPGQPSGTVVDLSAYVPSRADYSFDGWYADEDFTSSVSSVTMTDNLTVYAHWTSTVAGDEDVTVTNPDGSVTTVNTETDPATGTVTKSEDTEYLDGSFRSVVTVTKKDGSAESSEAAYDKNGNTTELIFTESKSGTIIRKTAYQIKGSKATAKTLVKAGSTSLAIPDTIEDLDENPYKVVAVASGICKGNTSLKKLVIGKNVQTIEASAFQGCKNLSSVRLNSKITKIGSKAFKGIKQGAVIKIKASQANYQKIVKMLKAAGCKKVEFQKMK